MSLLILTAIFGLILIDFLLIGFLPPVFGVWPRIKDLGNNPPIMESSLIGANTNIKGKYIDSMVNNRRGYQAAVLTKDHFYLKVNRLNYLLKIDVSSIKSIETAKGLLLKSLIMRLSNNGDDCYFEMSSTKLKEWLESFQSIGVKYK